VDTTNELPQFRCSVLVCRLAEGSLRPRRGAWRASFTLELSATALGAGVWLAVVLS
jgi:hypothetical protein